MPGTHVVEMKWDEQPEQAVFRKKTLTVLIDGDRHIKRVVLTLSGTAWDFASIAERQKS
jgi:hypothetical protein